MSFSSPWLAWLTAALVAAGAYAAPAGGDQGREEELRRRVAELERHKRVSDVEIARLRQEIARLQRELEAAQEEAEMARRDADQARAERLEAMEEGLVPSSAIEEADVPDEELELADVAPAPAAAARPGPAAPPEAVAPTPPVPVDRVTAEARELYDESYTLFHERRYAAAAASFGRFLELHPRTNLSDNAQFWIGECRYAQGDYDGALTAFMATVERYPAGNKVPDALVKAGKCLEGLGDKDGAVETYREIVRRFEGTVAAAVAGERLAELEAP